ncbi:MAG: hypothetical protein CMG62_11790 [Candidatus Marinimicrobia bacterium]|nr:hypothetical protein [Candidatus Neomarinimicrobiota bacterium]
MYDNLLIIQARMGSTRLPGKSAMKLAGKTLIAHIIERVKRVKFIDKIVVATTHLEEDNIIKKICDDENIECFRGSENNLLERYYYCALKFKSKNILRLPADNPFPEPEEYDRLITFFNNGKYDFCSNICNFLDNGYPDGIGVEIFSFESLEHIYFNQNHLTNKEHIGLNFYDYAKDTKNPYYKFSIGTIQCPKDFSRPDIILDINNLEEFKIAEDIYKYYYYTNSNFNIKDIIYWWNEYKK